MITLTRQLDGERLREWRYEGFPDATVLVVPLAGQLIELAVRVMDVPRHTAPLEAPRGATLDEIAEVADVLARRAQV